MVPNELRVASFFPDSGVLHGSSVNSGTPWTGCPIPRHGAHQGGVDGQLCPSEERQAVNHNLESARIKVVDGVEIQVSDQAIRAHPVTPPLGKCALLLLRFREEPPSAQDPSDCTS